MSSGQIPALNVLAKRRLALVVSGSVAAYKAAELARLWVKAGAEVRVVLTENAARFITPLTFESLTGQPVYTNMWAERQFEIEHISLADWAEAVVIAPATANLLAKAAGGLADDLASTFLLAAHKLPLLVAPAMNSRMWSAAATQKNINILKERKVEIISPQCGLLACGEIGDGRLAEVETIAFVAARTLGPGDLKGRRVTITAGSTWEPWDGIRYLANRSTGKMGLALASAAWLRGAEVTLLGGPGVALPLNLPGLHFQVAESTRDMLAALESLDYQTLIMAAAPADFRPAEKVVGKIKKENGPPPLSLAANPDILKSLTRKNDCFYVGFAAEDEELLARAQNKLEAKNLDLIVANQIGGPQGGAFASDDNHVWVLGRDGRFTEITARPKFEVAWAILDEIVAVTN